MMKKVTNRFWYHKIDIGNGCFTLQSDPTIKSETKHQSIVIPHPEITKISPLIMKNIKIIKHPTSTLPIIFATPNQHQCNSRITLSK